MFALGKGKKWKLMHSSLFLDFLAGNREYHCTPWGMPTRNVFGWQKPCYLLGEGYAKTFKELMETTDWDSYGTGRYEKCANCMAHCGYEPTAAHASISNPLSALWTALARRAHDGPDGAGNLARRSSGRRNTSSRATSRRCCTTSMRPSPTAAPMRRGAKPARAARCRPQPE